MEEKIKRINELARLKKERGLTEEEAKEQKALYEIVLTNVRSQVRAQLDQAGYTRKSSCQCGCQGIHHHHH